MKFVEELKKVRVRSYLNFFDMLPIYGTPTSRSVRLLARVIGGCPGGVFEKSCKGKQVLEKRETELELN